MISLDLKDPVAKVPGVGSVIANKLKKLDISSVEDLLWHLPTSYEDYSQKFLVAKAPVGQNLTLRGNLLGATTRQSWKRRLQLTEAILSDKTGSLPIIWFGKFPRKNLPEGEEVFVWGSIELKDGKRQMINPQIKKFKDGEAPKLQPIYPLTSGLSQWVIRNLIATTLKNISIADYHGKDFLKQHKLLSLAKTFAQIHQPDDQAEIETGRRRLAFDELFFLQLSQEVVRARRRSHVAPSLTGSLKEILPLFPPLTFDQEKAVAEISGDLKRSFPMARLLQGEVGSGKTIVAIIAAALSRQAGYQTLLLAPTEILAKQHFQSFTQHLGKHGYKLALYTRSQAELSGEALSRKTVVKEAVASGVADIIIGTQATLEESFKISKLGLVVVDEQHRFGVLDRLSSQTKTTGLVPHLLSMTATPIPRSLQLAFMGELDVSTLKTLPFGPRQIKTMLFATKDRRRVEEAIRRRVVKGEKIYVVCPLIDPSDSLGIKSVTAEYERLKSEAFADVPMGILHGRLPVAEKNKVLDDFKNGQTKILVSTTVVEVGVDVPEATVMVIEAAERFGLAQLHQLRGRVGRRGKEGVCVLFTEKASPLAEARLSAFAETLSGFALAELDLKFRGPGEWFGTKQAGYQEFVAADLSQTKLVNEAREAAAELVSEDPKLSKHKTLYWRVEKNLLAQYHIS
jgi:ATP-dependent DNA helicase RecG